MVHVDFDSLREGDLAIDLEIGTNAVVDEETSPYRNSINLLNRVWNGFAISNRSSKNEEDLQSGNNCLNPVEAPLENGEVLVDGRFGGEEPSPLEKKKVGDDKPKKKSCKKPPRPPRAPSMDAADQKLIREFSEIAMLKRARIERMKALKRTKNAKSASSGSNLFALVISIIFCFVIIWQGLFPSGGSSESFQGSPGSSAGARGGFISVQFYKNVSANHDYSSASPNSVEPISGLDDHGEANIGTRYPLWRILKVKKN